MSKISMQRERLGPVNPTVSVGSGLIFVFRSKPINGVAIGVYYAEAVSNFFGRSFSKVVRQQSITDFRNFLV